MWSICSVNLFTAENERSGGAAETTVVYKVRRAVDSNQNYGTLSKSCFVAFRASRGDTFNTEYTKNTQRTPRAAATHYSVLTTHYSVPGARRRVKEATN